jgi:hypothetical protein
MACPKSRCSGSGRSRWMAESSPTAHPGPLLKWSSGTDLPAQARPRVLRGSRHLHDVQGQRRPEWELWVVLMRERLKASAIELGHHAAHLR